jgi:hypothetical protein
LIEKEVTVLISFSFLYSYKSSIFSSYNISLSSDASAVKVSYTIQHRKRRPPLLFHYHIWTPDLEETEEFYKNCGFRIELQTYRDVIDGDSEKLGQLIIETRKNGFVHDVSHLFGKEISVGKTIA